MPDLPNCPKCECEYVYDDGSMLICPECAYEFTLKTDDSDDSEVADKVYKDANGNILVDGDTVTVIKDLKLKGSSQVIKVGTRVKNIRLVDSDHDIDCKVPGIGAMKLKSMFIKKV